MAKEETFKTAIRIALDYYNEGGEIPLDEPHMEDFLRACKMFVLEIEKEYKKPKK